MHRQGRAAGGGTGCNGSSGGGMGPNSASKGSSKKKKKKPQQQPPLLREPDANAGKSDAFGDGAGQELGVLPLPTSTLTSTPELALSSAMQAASIAEAEQGLEEEEPGDGEPEVSKPGQGGMSGWGGDDWEQQEQQQQGSEAYNAAQEGGWEVAASRRGRKGKAAPSSAGIVGRRPDAGNNGGGARGGRGGAAGAGAGAGQGRGAGRPQSKNNNGYSASSFASSSASASAAAWGGDWADNSSDAASAQQQQQRAWQRGNVPARGRAAAAGNAVLYNKASAEASRNVRLDGWGNPVGDADAQALVLPVAPAWGNLGGASAAHSPWGHEVPAPAPAPAPLPVGAAWQGAAWQGGPDVEAARWAEASFRQLDRSGPGPGPALQPPSIEDYPVSVLSASQSEDDLPDDSDYLSEDSDSEAEDFQANSKWFQPFFDALRNLSVEQMSEFDRQWHCPACKGGVGAIDWYRGLQPLLTHAQTIRAKRVKLHRMFASLLEDELRQRGAAASAAVAGKFGKWKGLRETDESLNPLVLWPPMVVVQNTQLEMDEQDKWIGMGNQELLDHFREYNAVKARHAYGPQGHRGMSIVIFGDSPSGYYDAQRLDKAFKEARRGRDDWYRQSKTLYQPGSSGQRILYGYMANKEDVEVFNRHGRGKMLLKCEMKRLNETVLEPMRQQDEDFHQVTYLKDKVQKAQQHRKELERTVCVITRQLRLREEEIKEIQMRAEEQNFKNKKSLEDMEKYFEEKLQTYRDKVASEENKEQEKLREAYDKNIEACQRLETKASKLDGAEHQLEQRKLEEEIARQSRLVEAGLRRAEEYESRKNEIQQQFHLRKLALRQQQHEETLALEKELESERGTILNDYKTDSQRLFNQFGSYQNAG